MGGRGSCRATDDTRGSAGASPSRRGRPESHCDADLTPPPPKRLMSVATATRRFTVALIGNPNTGKSTLFTALCGVRQRVGNYPGVTVEKKVGRLAHGHHHYHLIDLPGTY